MSWQWLDHTGYKPYDSAVQNTVEAAWRAYSGTGGPSFIVVQFPGRPESYRIDFISGTQTNMVSGEARGIRRV